MWWSKILCDSGGNVKKVLYFGNLYHAEASLAADLNAGSMYQFVPVYTTDFNDTFDNDFKPYAHFRSMFPGPTIRPVREDMNEVIDREKPDVVIDRCWVDFSKYPFSGTIFWKIESAARTRPRQQLPEILPVPGHAAFLTFNAAEIPHYRRVLNIPVGYLPYCVSRYWERPLEKTINVMTTGTCVNQEKIESYELLVRPLCEHLPPTDVYVYAHYGASNIPWAKEHLRTPYYAEQGPLLMGHSRIFVSPVTTRFDRGTISQKTLQAMGCQALVLTQRYKGVEQVLGPDGKYVVYADSPKEAIDKVRYYLEHENERQEIAFRAYEHVHKSYNASMVFTRALEQIGVQ
jgi:hypothetical protein